MVNASDKATTQEKNKSQRAIVLSTINHANKNLEKKETILSNFSYLTPSERLLILEEERNLLLHKSQSPTRLSPGLISPRIVNRKSIRNDEFDNHHRTFPSISEIRQNASLKKDTAIVQ